MSRLQSVHAVADADAQGDDIPQERLKPRNLSGWRTVKELVEELRFPSDHACRMWLSRQGIASVKRGRVILVSGVDVDRALRGR